METQKMLKSIVNKDYWLEEQMREIEKDAMINYSQEEAVKAVSRHILNLVKGDLDAQVDW